MAEKHRVVAGVDGSDNALAAARWAYRYAMATGADLEVVNVWIVPYAGPRTGTTVPENLLELDGGKILKEAVDEVAKVDETHSVKIHPTLVHGAPAEQLCKLAEGADCLVVGARGRGGFAALLVGSVSDQCVHHAPCPVVVVRD